MAKVEDIESVTIITASIQFNTSELIYLKNVMQNQCTSLEGTQEKQIREELFNLFNTCLQEEK